MHIGGVWISSSFQPGQACYFLSPSWLAPRWGLGYSVKTCTDQNSGNSLLNQHIEDWLLTPHRIQPEYDHNTICYNYTATSIDTKKCMQWNDLCGEQIKLTSKRDLYM